MLIRVLVLFLSPILFLNPARAAGNSISVMPGFLGDSVFSSLLESPDEKDPKRAAQITRDGWDLPEFRAFASTGLAVPGDQDPESGAWLHPGTARFYYFMDYLVFGKFGVPRATLALDCSEQELRTSAAKDAPLKTRRELAEGIFDLSSIPREVVWLAAQESGFQDRALSPVGAYGVWQFMPATGTRYGASGRKRADFTVATPAAAKYLKKLFDQFGDWGLAMAAYNSGEGNVDKGVERAAAAMAKKGIFTDPTFWNIYRYLPSETRDYVPAILAWTRIALDPARFGFKPDGKACRQFSGSERR